MTASIPAKWREHVPRTNDSPSRRHNVSADRELKELQGVANFIQELARKLQLPLICINTAIVYTQRFYLYHSLTLFEKHCIGASALFLAAKVEDHLRKAEHVYQAVKLLGRVNKEVNDADYIDDMLFNENIILQTLGFEIYIEHPHTHVVRLCEMFKMSKNFSQTAYIFATYCLQLTRMCLFNKPGIVACVCIRMACKMMNETPQTRDGRNWYQMGDSTLTDVVLDGLCDEFQAVLNTCPPQWRNKTLLNNHQNLANRMVLSPAGLPMFGEGPSNSDSDKSNPALNEIKRSSSLEQFSQRTPESSGNTPQTLHRFTELPSLTSNDQANKPSSLAPIDNQLKERKPSTSSQSSGHPKSCPPKANNEHHQAKHPTPEKKKHQKHPAVKLNLSDEKKAHFGRSLLKPNLGLEQKHPQHANSAIKLEQPDEKQHQVQKNHNPRHSAIKLEPPDETLHQVQKNHNPRHSAIKLEPPDETQHQVQKNHNPWNSAIKLEPPDEKKHQVQKKNNPSHSAHKSHMNNDRKHHPGHSGNHQNTAPKPNPWTDKKHHPGHSTHHQHTAPKPNPLTEKKHHSGHSSNHEHVTPKPNHLTEKKRHQSHWPPKNHAQSMPNLDNARRHHHPAQPFHKTRPTVPKEGPNPSPSKTFRRNEHQPSQNHRRHSSKPESGASSHPALSETYNKADESHTSRKNIEKDLNQRKTSHSVSQAQPAAKPWSPASLDFTCLSDSYTDFDPWGALLNTSLSPKYHPVQRDPSLTSASSGMNLLKINPDTETSRRSTTPDFGEHYPKRFKSN